MTAYWTVWLFLFVPLTFALGEGYALWKGKTTLSRYIWTLSKAWPPFPFVAIISSLDDDHQPPLLVP